MFTDVNGDGRPDLYVANDLDPNRLYVNEPRRDGLGFRFVEAGGKERVDDPNAGMGIAVGDYSGDGREDLFVTNSRGQLHAAYRARAGHPYADARPDFVGALGQQYTGWGASWADGRLLLCAVDRDSGRRVVFGSRSAPQATVGQAVAASCAIPGVFRPVLIRGKRYVDGGAWTPTNGDAAPAGRGDRVLKV